MSSIYDLVKCYYENSQFTKTENKDGFSIYMSKVNTFLNNTFRYLIALCDEDVYFIGHTIPIAQLSWKVFQTRTIPINHDIISAQFRPKQQPPYNLPIYVSKRHPSYTIYRPQQSNYPITITLLHKSNDNTHEYPDQGTLVAALETYQTIITIDHNTS